MRRNSTGSVSDRLKPKMVDEVADLPPDLTVGPSPDPLDVFRGEAPQLQTRSGWRV